MEITDDMTRNALGADAANWLVGHTVVSVHPVVDSDRGEEMLVLDNGTVLMLSCDPGYADDVAMSRTPDRWEVFLYDATDTEAGKALLAAQPSRST